MKTLLTSILALFLLVGCQYTKANAPSKSGEATVTHFCPRVVSPDTTVLAWGGDCDEPYTLVWPEGKTTYLLDPEIEMPTTVKAAFEQWNVWLGWEMFVEVYDDSADVVVYREFNTPPGLYPIGSAALGFYQGDLIGLLTLYDGYVYNAFKVATHEIGHLLGLEHDENNMLSLMYPTVHDGPMPVTEDDIKAIRRLYSGG
jgi:predicted Zn-dependent protease